MRRSWSRSGAFTGFTTTAEVLETCRAVTGSDATLSWVTPEQIVAAGVEPTAGRVGDAALLVPPQQVELLGQRERVEDQLRARIRGPGGVAPGVITAAPGPGCGRGGGWIVIVVRFGTRRVTRLVRMVVPGFMILAVAAAWAADPSPARLPPRNGKTGQ